MKIKTVTNEEIKALKSMGYQWFGVHYLNHHDYRRPLKLDSSEFPASLYGHFDHDAAEDLNYDIVLSVENLYDQLQEIESLVPIWDEEFLGEVMQNNNEDVLQVFTS